MAEKTISLKLKIVQPGDTKKALDGLKSVATNWDKVFGPNGDKPIKNVKRQVGELTRTWQDLGKAIKLAHDNFKLGFDSGSQSMHGLKSFTDGLEKATKKVFNLKNAIMGTAVGAGAVYLGHKLFEEGAQQIRTRKRLRREFGGEAGDIEGAAKRINFGAGIQDDEAAKGLIPLAEQLQAIQGGAQFRGMKRPLTEAQATALRKKNLNYGADLFKRVSALAPDVESDELGRVLGDALSGPEGIRSMISTLHLSKRSRTLSTANEKGEAFKVLSPEERKRLGITKKGQYVEQGDLVNLMLERSGMTDKAAQDEQKNFGHQMRQIKSTLLDQVGDLGSGAIDALTEKLGQGATAAQRLQNYLKSDAGKKTIEGIKDAVVKVVEGVANIAQDLPKIGQWLGKHKTLLEVLAGAYGVMKVAPTAVGLVKGASAMINGVRGATPATPLFVSVTNNGLPGAAPGVGGKAAGLLKKAGWVAAAGVAGYEAGTWLDEKLGLSDKLAGGAQSDPLMEAVNKKVVGRLKLERGSKINDLEGTGIGHGLAVRYADHPDEYQGGDSKIKSILSRPIEIVNNTNLVVDGHMLAKVVDKHQVRQMDNRTGRGVSPVSKE